MIAYLTQNRNKIVCFNDFYCNIVEFTIVVFKRSFLIIIYLNILKFDLSHCLSKFKAVPPGR